MIPTALQTPAVVLVFKVKLELLPAKMQAQAALLAAVCKNNIQTGPWILSGSTVCDTPPSPDSSSSSPLCGIFTFIY